MTFRVGQIIGGQANANLLVSVTASDLHDPSHVASPAILTAGIASLQPVTITQQYYDPLTDTGIATCTGMLQIWDNSVIPMITGIVIHYDLGDGPQFLDVIDTKMVRLGLGEIFEADFDFQLFGQGNMAY